MKRRTFLKTAAGTAMTTPFLAREALSAQELSQIKHVVVVMMENRSFDHYLGWLPNADGKQAGLTYVDKNGESQAAHPLAPDWTGCGFEDPDHSYTGSRI
jgi:phospholipase C